MSRVVVDTDVVSFLFKNDSRAVRYHAHLMGKEMIISFMTLAELHLWARMRNWGPDRLARLDRHVRGFGVHPYNAALCRVWADVTHQTARAGRRIETADAWVAATALLHGLPLITHNASDYRGVSGLKVVSESSE
jgi:predicted nucleic acid-binding protein